MLTEPKPHVFFDAPEKPLAPARFAGAAAKRGVRLDARTQLLFSGAKFFINGEPAPVPAADRAALRELADRRALASTQGLSATGLALLREWYLCGFVTIA
jgi:50S ribosomal protein L16 3-hydroxylase